MPNIQVAMSAGVIRLYPEAGARALSMLYFTNSLGAAVGDAFATGDQAAMQARLLLGSLERSAVRTAGMHAAITATAPAVTPVPPAPAVKPERPAATASASQAKTAAAAPADHRHAGRGAHDLLHASP